MFFFLPFCFMRTAGFGNNPRFFDLLLSLLLWGILLRDNTSLDKGFKSFALRWGKEQKG